MKKVKYRLLYLLSIVCSGIFIACSEDADNNINDSSENILASDVNKILITEPVMGVVDALTLSTAMFEDSWENSCYKLVRKEEGYTVSFSDCEVNGFLLNGDVDVVLNSLESFQGMSYTYENFSINGNRYSGTRSFVLTDFGHSFSFLVFEVISTLSITMGDGIQVTETGNYAVMYDFENPIVNAWSLGGNWDLTYGNDTYTVNVINKLWGDSNGGSSPCKYITKGILNFNKNQQDEIGVDFGYNECDSLINIIYPDGTEKTIDIANL